MLQMLPDVSSEIQMAISGTVKSIMEKKIIPVDTFVQTFLHSILTGTENQHSQVADTWVNCLIEVIPFLPLSVLHKEVYPVAIQKTMHDQPVHSRVSSCKIIGALCTRYPCQELKRDLLPVVLSLCQDVNADVRAAIAFQLHHVIRPLGSENTEKLLLPLLVDLAAEIITKVKEAALFAVVESIPFLSSEPLKVIVLPLLKQLMSYSLESKSTLIVAVAMSYGKILAGIEKIILSSEKEFYLKYYESLVEKTMDKKPQTKLQSTESSMQITRLPMGLAMDARKHCAYNFVTVVKFVYNDNSRAHLDILHALLVKLMADSFIDTRKAIASYMYDIIIAYGKYKLLLKPQVIQLINDDVEDVLEGIIPRLSNILLEFARSGAYRLDQLNPGNSQILQALEHCELVLVESYNWRLYSAFLQQMEVLFYFCPTEILYSRFLELYFNRIFQRRVLPLRLAFIRTILVNMKYSQKAPQQSDLLNKIAELSCSRNFYDRMLYVRICDIILDVYSTNYFKEHFFLRTINLKDDPVPNIRWGFCKLLPALTNMIVLPGEETLKKLVDEAIEKLKNDMDNEVRLTLNKILIELESPNPNVFIEDRRKLKEERKLAYLDSAIIQTFPMVFDPSVDGIKRIGQCVTEQGPYCSRIQQGFTDKEFLVDAGVALPKQTFVKTSPPKISQCDIDTKNKQTVPIKSIDKRAADTLDNANFGKRVEEIVVNKNYEKEIDRSLTIRSVGKQLDETKFNRQFDKKLKMMENGNIEKNPIEINSNVSRAGTFDGKSIEEINKNTEVSEEDESKFKQNESKNSPKKKQLFRHSIPIRKKPNSADLLTPKSPEVTERRQKAQTANKGKRLSLQVLENEHVQSIEMKSFENRPLRDVEKRRSLNVVPSSCKPIFDVPSLDKKSSVTDACKRHSLEVVDINKNLTGSPSANVTCSSNAVQRRKKSQLPRPLSCVVLPVRNSGLDKPNSASKLPVMRRP